MGLYRLIPFVLAVPVIVYLYIFLSRIVSLTGGWYNNEESEDHACMNPHLTRKPSKRQLRWYKKKAGRAVILLAAVALMIPALDIWGLWTVILLHIVAASLLVDLIVLLLRIWKKEWSPAWKTIYRSGLIPFAIAALILGYGYFNMHYVIQTEYTVNTEKHIREEGYDVLFLSDLHFGTTMDADDLQEVCSRMEETQPDLVILGGDIVDENSTLDQVREAFAALGQIDSTYGTFYVYGNHDKGRYRPDCDFTAEELADAAESAGVRILEDETVRLGDALTLTGRRDRSDASMDGIVREDAETLLEGTEEGAFHIMADHQPRGMEENAEAGYDLMLSGHTHAGQIWPVGLFTTLLDKETINYGEERFGTMEAIVSSGIAGWGYPLRTGKHSEYVLVHIEGHSSSGL